MKNIEVLKPQWLGEVEGTELKAAAQWLRRVTDITGRLKITKKGYTISFRDGPNTIAGKMHIPTAVKVADGIETGFTADRFYNIFATFKKGEKAKLWFKGGDRGKLLVKSGNSPLKWSHGLLGIEEAMKAIDFSKIGKGAVKLNIADIVEAVKINTGRKVAEKYNFIAFVYKGVKVHVYAIREGDYNKRQEIELIKTVKAVESANIEGVAIYSIELVNNILKGVKTGIIRVEARTPLKAAIDVGKTARAVAFVAPCVNVEWEEALTGAGKVPAPVKEEVKEEVTEELKEDIKSKEDITERTQKEEYKAAETKEGKTVYVRFFNSLSNSKEVIYRDKEGQEYLSGDLSFAKADKEEDIRYDMYNQKAQEETAKEQRVKAQRAKLERTRDNVKILRSGKVENARTSEYGRTIRLEQIGSFYRIVIEKGADRMSAAKMRGYKTEAEALKRYEWFIEVW